MSAVISEQCLYAIPITAYISTDLEIFRMLLIILHCRVSFSAQQACCWTLFTHFLNCLHLLYVHKNRRPLDYSIRALAIYTVYGLSLALSVCFFHFTSVWTQTAVCRHFSTTKMCRLQLIENAMLIFFLCLYIYFNLCNVKEYIGNVSDIFVFTLWISKTLNRPFGLQVNVINEMDLFSMHSNHWH